MAGKDDVSDDEVDGALAEIYDNHRSELYEMIYGYADDEELEEGFLAHLLLDLAVSSRLNAYGAETDTPTAAGLRADLDVFVKEITDLVREAKKEAEAFVEALNRAQDDDDED